MKEKQKSKSESAEEPKTENQKIMERLHYFNKLKDKEEDEEQ